MQSKRRLCNREMHAVQFSGLGGWNIGQRLAVHTEFRLLLSRNIFFISRSHIEL